MKLSNGDGFKKYCWESTSISEPTDELPYTTHRKWGFTGVYFARPLNPVESISIFQTAPRPATYNVLFFGPLKARPWQS